MALTAFVLHSTKPTLVTRIIVLQDTHSSSAFGAEDLRDVSPKGMQARNGRPVVCSSFWGLAPLASFVALRGGVIARSLYLVTGEGDAPVNQDILFLLGAVLHSLAKPFLAGADWQKRIALRRSSTL